jgi:hypothetical protein
MASTINDLIAAELSDAAYGKAAPPPGWTPIYKTSADTVLLGGSSFTIYTNGYSQLVIVFKGTDSAIEGYSDIKDDGGSRWEAIAPLFNKELLAIKSNPKYAGYEIFTDGHSLGGGMAQTAALENGLSGSVRTRFPFRL